jgi:PTH1 family peptidyl-tRNA hydrolase
VKLLVGLGNPGRRYADTRHNAGVRVVERFAERHGLRLDAQRFDSRFGRGRVAFAPGPALDVGVLAPLTYMNRSGAAVAEALRSLPLEGPAEDLLIVLDDVDLPFGRLRLRASGSAGGHRGLADVIAALGRDDLPRLRFGVGRPPAPIDTADWVLMPFAPEEAERLPGLLDAAAAAVDAAFGLGIRVAMDSVNRPPPAEPGPGG